MADMRRCGIIGAGSVGAASAYTLAVSGLFSEVVLLDADEQKAEGEAADIAHGAALGVPAGCMPGNTRTSRTAASSFWRRARTRGRAKRARRFSGATARYCAAFWSAHARQPRSYPACRSESRGHSHRVRAFAFRVSAGARHRLRNRPRHGAGQVPSRAQARRGQPQRPCIHAR